jgi:DNA-directed RNA polymerase subunit M/transcription elongation factor TFIIS/Zn-finger nucleic acid-binding protein
MLTSEVGAPRLAGETSCRSEAHGSTVGEPEKPAREEGLNCPNCGTEMERQALEGKLGVEIEVDICYGCHVLWLDKRESLHLSAGGTLDLFKALNEHRDDARQALRATNQCPRCGGRLKLQNDIGKGGRFSYYRCAQHGRLEPFSEFLKEKEFVRTLNPLEKQRLSAEVKQVQCSSCGAPVQLSEGFACGHCGSPLTVLDPEAVTKTLQELNDADAAQKAVAPEVAEARARALAAMENVRRERPDPYDRSSGSFNISITRGGHRGSAGEDLLSTSINFLVRLLG